MYESDLVRSGAFLPWILAFLAGIFIVGALSTVTSKRRHCMPNDYLNSSRTSRRLQITGEFASTIAGVFLLFVNPNFERTLPFFLFVSLCLGVATGLFLLRWESLMAQLPIKPRIALVTSYLAVASVLFPVCFALSIPALCIITASGATISFLSLMMALTRRPEVEPSNRRTENSDLFRKNAARLSQRFLVASFTIGLAYGFMGYQFAVSSHSKVPPILWGYGIFGAALFLLILMSSLVLRKEFDVVFAYRISGFLAVPAFFPLDPGSAFSLVFAVAFTLISAVSIIGMVALVQDEVRRTIGSNARGGSFAGLSLGCFAGIILGIGMMAIPEIFDFSLSGTLSISLLGLLSIIIVLVATNVLIDKELFRSVLLASAGKVPLSFDIASSIFNHIDNDEGVLIRRCSNIALQKGLTPRETEVLLILAKGNSLQRVQEELFISQGTVTTHRNNIYRKLGIHSKQELVDYMEDFRLQNH
jgi:DNA-binding CsgD family transcriptional regulator/MFS family permease